MPPTYLFGQPRQFESVAAPVAPYNDAEVTVKGVVAKVNRWIIAIAKRLHLILLLLLAIAIIIATADAFHSHSLARHREIRDEIAYPAFVKAARIGAYGTFDDNDFVNFVAETYGSVYSERNVTGVIMHVRLYSRVVVDDVVVGTISLCWKSVTSPVYPIYRWVRRQVVSAYNCMNLYLLLSGTTLGLCVFSAVIKVIPTLPWADIVPWIGGCCLACCRSNGDNLAGNIGNHDARVSWWSSYQRGNVTSTAAPMQSSPPPSIYPVLPRTDQRPPASSHHVAAHPEPAAHPLSSVIWSTVQNVAEDVKSRLTSSSSLFGTPLANPLFGDSSAPVGPAKPVHSVAERRKKMEETEALIERTKAELYMLRNGQLS